MPAPKTKTKPSQPKNGEARRAAGSMSDLPKGWEVFKLTELTTKVGSGSTPKGGKNAYQDSGIPLIRSMNVHFDGFKMNGLAFISDAQAKKLQNVVVESGDVLLNITGASIGRVTTAPEDMSGARVNQHVSIIRPTEALNPKYLARFLASPSQQDLIDRIQVGATRQALTKSMILDFEIPLPPLPEQHRIVARIEELFSRLDAGVASLRHAKAQLQRYRQSVLAAAVTGQLTQAWREQHPDAEPASELLVRGLINARVSWCGNRSFPKPSELNAKDLQDLPKGWAWATVDQTGDVKLGRQRSPKHMTGDHVRPYLRVANVFEDRIDTSDVKKMNFTPDEFKVYELKYGDILLNEGQSLEWVGRPAMYRNEIKGCCFQNTLVRYRAYESVLPVYALTVFRCYLQRGRFQKIAKWTNNIAHLGAARFKEIEFPLPPLAEQHQIVAEVESRSTAIEHLEAELDRQIARSNRLRKSVLQFAFLGKL